jgi:hypothetical protein
MNEYTLSFDVDWVSDWAIMQVADILIQNKIKSTWFITHDSPAIRELINMPDLFEIGLHPNLMPGTTQGKTEDDIFKQLRKIAPDAEIVRTHGLVFSNALMKNLILKYGVRFDSSVLLFESANIEPHMRYYKETNTPMIRLPYFWEDSIEILKPNPSFDIGNPKYHVDGLKVFDFHPVHVVLNTCDIHAYNWCKNNIGVGQINGGNTKMIRNGCLMGAHTLLGGLIEHMRETHHGGRTLSEIGRWWLEERG